MDAGLRKRILIVDDELAVGRALRRNLHGPFEVELALSCEDALSRLRGGARFDAILCDIRMPAMGGDIFHAELLRGFPEQAARVVFITAAGGYRGVLRFLDSVPNPRLEKPFSVSDLRRLLDALFARGPGASRVTNPG
jgi:CheY-like chemotaxis protein